MNTPTGPRADEPLDGQVRNLLWRLRARMVTPPSEQRVQADLDRIFRAAHDTAHSHPSLGASERPELVGAALAPDHGLGSTTASGHGTVASESVASLDARRRPRRISTTVVGRVAAAMIVLVVASGVAGAREGVVTLQALLGRGETPVAATVDDGTLLPALAAPGQDVEAGDVPVDEIDASSDAAPVEQPSDVPAGAEADERDEVEVTEPVTEPAAPAARPEPAPTDPEPDSEPATPGPTDSRPGEQSPEQSPEPSREQPPVESPAESPATGSDRTPTTPPPSKIVDEPILAAPELPVDVDGFGGPRECGVDDPVMCLPAGDSEDTADGSEPVDGDDPATDESTTDDPATDESSSDDEDGDEADEDGDAAADAEGEELAKRRFRPPPAE